MKKLRRLVLKLNNGFVAIVLAIVYLTLFLIPAPFLYIHNFYRRTIDRSKDSYWIKPKGEFNPKSSY